MLAAVDLDYETMFTTQKIHHIWPQRLLPDKLVTIQCTRSPAIP